LKRYQVRPKAGTIKAGDSVDIEVTFIEAASLTAHSSTVVCEDKFLVQQLSKADVDPHDWAKGAKSSALVRRTPRLIYSPCPSCP
jgi:hypothetical protein